MSRRTRLVLVDLDNTLYDWVRFFVPAMLAMTAEICRDLSADEASILGELRSVYARHGSVEYAFCVQALPSVARLPLARRRALVNRSREAFSEARNEHLVTYPGVPETLGELHAAGIAVVATTNSPMYEATRRLERLGVLGAFAGIAARRSFPVPDGDDMGDGSGFTRRRSHRPLDRLWELEPGHLKPAIRMYERALRGTQTEPWATLAVGDHFGNDLAPALRLGARAAWAGYGVAVEPALWQRLLAVTPWTRAAVAAREETPPAEVPVLKSFSDVLALI